MPRGDRRGPDGAGPMTGRALGYCAGNDRLGFAVDAAPQGAGRSLRNGGGRGPGFGRGCGHGSGRRIAYGRNFASAERDYYPPAAENESENSRENYNDSEVKELKDLVKNLSSELEAVKKKMDDLNNN